MMTLPNSFKNSGMGTTRGFTLVELMIAMAIGLVVLLALTTLFINSSETRRELDKSAILLENGRYAMQLLRDELQLAGFYDALSNPPDPADPSAVPCSTALDDWRTSLGLAVLGANSGGFACVASEDTTTGSIFIQRASTRTTAAADRAATRPYLQISFCGETYEASPFVLDLGNAATFVLQQIDCDATKLAPTRELVRRFYFVGNDDVGTPSLMRRNTDGSVESLVEGIEAMRFEFDLDTNKDGSPDEAKAAPTAAEWLDVVGVRVWILARALEETRGYADSGPEKTFVLGSAAPVSFDDNFKRQVFTSYVELINPAGRRQQ